MPVRLVSVRIYTIKACCFLLTLSGLIAGLDADATVDALEACFDAFDSFGAAFGLTTFTWPFRASFDDESGREAFGLTIFALPFKGSLDGESAPLDELESLDEELDDDFDTGFSDGLIASVSLIGDETSESEELDESEDDCDMLLNRCRTMN